MRHYKVWAVDSRGKRGELLLRTGSNERPEDILMFDGTPMDVALFTCRRNTYLGRLVVKNFDTDEWYEANVPSLDPQYGYSISGPSKIEPGVDEVTITLPSNVVEAIDKYITSDWAPGLAPLNAVAWIGEQVVALVRKAPR